MLADISYNGKDICVNTSTFIEDLQTPEADRDALLGCA